MLKLPQFRALSLAETPAFVKVTGSKFENDLKDFRYGLTSFCLFYWTLDWFVWVCFSAEPPPRVF